MPKYDPCLLYLEEDELGQLLMFVTGMESIPALGFEPEPNVTFGHGETSHKFPVVSTCTNSIQLPIVKTYQEFVFNMKSAMHMAKTFTLA